MSLRRIGSRAVVVGLGVLASLALMAAPSLAAKGGNSANAKLCEPGGYPGVLFNQLGEGFKNAGACTKYAAKGGKLAGVDAVAELAVGGSFNATCSGFGLAPPNLETDCVAFYSSGASSTVPKQNAADGTVSISATFPCTHEGSKVDALVVIAVTAEAEVIREFPPPNGC
jgi:hypothetical protein